MNNEVLQKYNSVLVLFKKEFFFQKTGDTFCSHATNRYITKFKYKD